MTLFRLEIVGLFLLGGFNFLVGAVAENPLAEGALQFGALGLCGLMVWQQRQDRRDQLKQQVQERADLLQEIKRLNEKAEERDRSVVQLHTDTLDVIRKCKSKGD